MEKKQFRVIKECEIDMRIIGNVNENSFFRGRQKALVPLSYIRIETLWKLHKNI